MWDLTLPRWVSGWAIAPSLARELTILFENLMRLRARSLAPFVDMVDRANRHRLNWRAEEVRSKSRFTTDGILSLLGLAFGHVLDRLD